MRLIHAVTIALGTVIALTTAAPAPAQQIKALNFASVVDGSGRVMPHGVVIVSGDKIVRVAGPRDALPPNAQVVDLTRYTAIPGMIDVHTHMTYYWDSTSGTDPWRQPARTPEQTVQLARAQRAAERSRPGVTTVRDLGASNYTDVALRDSINKGGWIGPRMFVAGLRARSARGRPFARTPIRRARRAAAYTTSLKSRKR